MTATELHAALSPIMGREALPEKLEYHFDTHDLWTWRWNSAVCQEIHPDAACLIAEAAMVRWLVERRLIYPRPGIVSVLDSNRQEWDDYGNGSFTAALAAACVAVLEDETK